MSEFPGENEDFMEEKTPGTSQAEGEKQETGNQGLNHHSAFENQKCLG